ncbi:MAG: D-alanine--D-alanine ligase [Bacteroidota bacterium]
MIDLPAEISPLRVALVYNEKKEDATQQSADDSTEPPSLSRRGIPADANVAVSTATLQRVTDLYAEWDTRETIHAVRDALAEFHDVILIEADEYAFDSLRIERPDIVFNIAEGMHGVSRESQIPAMLEFLQIPYTGSDSLTLALCLDKSRAKEILSYARIPTPQFAIIRDPRDLDTFGQKLPCIVKPLHEGSSKGIFNSSVVHTESELRMQVRSLLLTYNEPALIEEYLEGREFTVALLGNDDTLNVLPIVEIRFDSLPRGVNHIYSYEAKWIWDRSDAPLDIFQCPADIPPRLQSDIERLCRDAYTVLRCRDWCRIDVRLDAHDQPHILELNPLPGILPKPEDNSCFPKAARAAGIPYDQLIQTVLALAAKRYNLGGQTISFHSQQHQRCS